MPPRIVTARSMGLQFVASKLAAMGPERGVIGHYSAGARAKNMAEGIARAKSFHHDHQVNRGWAGIGYHYLITDDGVIICCRSTFHTGSHTKGHNSGQIGVNMPGTLTATIKDKPTRRQARTFNWLLHNAHTAAMPRQHRTDVNLSTVPRKGHNDFMATSCPGLFKGMYLKGGEPWVEPSGDEQPDDGFADLMPEDEEVVAEVDRGNVPDHEADLEAEGPEAEEKDAPGGPEDLELPEADDEFDEDLGEVLAEIQEKEGTRV
jgi:hypothetical protein